MGCVGRLVSVQPLPDGRSNILLQGLHRFEICEQFFEKSYREVRAILKPGEADVSLEPPVRAELLQTLERYLSVREDGQQWRELVHRNLDDEVLVNSLATFLDLTPLEKQFLVEADSLLQRARRLHDLLQFKLDERGGAKGWG
jgi:Lon protease-like protein